MQDMPPRCHEWAPSVGSCCLSAFLIHARDGGTVADALQARQLLANDPALQARMDGLHLGCLACKKHQGSTNVAGHRQA